jgi:hypothetical protein
VLAPSGLPLTSLLQKRHHTDEITCRDAADRSTTIRGVEHFPLRTQEKFAWLNDPSRLIPVSPNTVRILGYRQTVPYGEGQMKFRDSLLRLLQWVGRKRHDRHVERVQDIEMGLIVS